MDKNNPILVALQAARSAFRAGDSVRALAACEAVLEHVPNHPMAHLMAGLLQQQAGDHESAIRHLRFAVAHDPRDSEARDALAMCLLARGRHAEAMPHLRQVIAADPENVSARFNLGRCLLDLRNFAEAERVYEVHVEKHPGDAEGFNHLGLARLAKGNPAAAAQCFQTAIQLNEHDPLFHANLAQAHEQQGNAREASAAYGRAVALDPSNASLRAQEGWHLLNHGFPIRAEDRFREALQRDPEHESANAGLAAALERRQEVEVGLRVLRPFISAVVPHPKVAISYAALSQHGSQPNQALPVVRRAIRPGVAKATEAALRFAEGDLLDAMGEVDAAFEAYQQANVAQGSRYDAQTHRRFVDSLVEVFTPELFASIPKPEVDTSSSVLVVGMPRSGVSVIDQMLAQHPDIHSAGELDDFSTIAGGLPHYIDDNRSYPELVRGLTAPLVNELATARMDSLRRAAVAPLVVDRFFNNFMHLGLAAVLTPGAKVIHAVRDPLDTCLACFFQHFGGSRYAFSTQLDALKSFYCEYDRLMKHWSAVLPLEVYTVEYEAMVADPQAVARAMFDHLGCDWRADGCDLDQIQRLVHAASHAQAQRPVSASSVGRAERYRHRLGSLVSLAQLRA